MWQSIETAPKDESIIFLFDPNWYNVPFAGSWDKSIERWRSFETNEVHYPTHWALMMGIPNEQKT